MSSLGADALTDLLADACLAYDVRKVKRALTSGANPNRPTHQGYRPVHILVDPGNQGTDARQAKCLALLLAAGVEMQHKHQFAYTVCERISFFLPHCARVVIEHHQGLPDEVDLMDQDHRAWWQKLMGKWKSEKQALALSLATPHAANDAHPRRF